MTTQQSSRKRILFTGGGTSGHVTPNIALIEKFQQQDWVVFYLGSTAGIEKALITRNVQICAKMECQKPKSFVTISLLFAK